MEIPELMSPHSQKSTVKETIQKALRMVDEASLGFDPIRFDLELNRRNANKPADLEVELKKERTRNRLPSRKLVQVVAFGTHTHIYIYTHHLHQAALLPNLAQQLLADDVAVKP